MAVLGSNPGRLRPGFSLVFGHRQDQALDGVLAILWHPNRNVELPTVDLNYLRLGHAFSRHGKSLNEWPLAGVVHGVRQPLQVFQRSEALRWPEPQPVRSLGPEFAPNLREFGLVLLGSGPGKSQVRFEEG